MSLAAAGLALAVFIACAVEAVEALTIVLALGATRGWRWALAGAAAALLTLAALVGALGPAIASLPLDALRLLVGVTLLVIGAQWLRKAVLRAAGRKALHDEQASYRDATRAAAGAAERERGQRKGVDRYAFATSYGAVLLEGFEVVVIVISFAASGRRLGLAALAAGCAVLLVALAGLLVRRPLARVPENTLKLTVGVLLVSFGIFWLGEGAKLAWPAGEAILLPLIGAVALAALLTARRLRVQPS